MIGTQWRIRSPETYRHIMLPLLPLRSFFAGVLMSQFCPNTFLSAPLYKKTSMSRPPTSLQCSSIHGVNRYDLSHVTQYLDQVEECLQSHTTLSPGLRYGHCFGSEEKKTLFKVVGSVLAKPMLRTLIYGGKFERNLSSHVVEYEAKSAKVHFDQRIRESREQIEGQRMHSFMVETLLPAAEALDADIRDEKVPELLDQINVARKVVDDVSEASPMVWGKATRRTFSRLARGRRYQGKLHSLIADVFPELTDKYCEATQKATDREVLEFVINTDLVYRTENKGDLVGDEELTAKRISAAFKCLDRFYPISPSSEERHSVAGMISGKQSEKSCIQFLRREYSRSRQKNVEESNPTTHILQNVYVNARTNGDHTKNRKLTSPGRKLAETGIIWTDCARHRLCSEFDAVVVSCEASGKLDESNSSYIESVWEAKKTISPSTLHDILTKKLGAIEALVRSQTSELVFEHGVVPFDRMVGLTFGIYGSELQQPENAADSIRSIAAAHVINSNLEEVIRSLDGNVVMVEVDLTNALDIIQGLKSIVQSVQSQSKFDVIFFVEENGHIK
ncbi:hypothetical protein ACHAWF_013248 [Thalassiosira exigua]